MVIREKFEEDMQNLKKRLHGIGKITIEMMEKSFVCIQTHDKVHSQEIIDMDMIINDLQEKIYDNGIILLTKQQPVAIDLRRIIVAMNNASEIERIADFATNICKSVIRSTGPLSFVDLNDVQLMIQKCREMVLAALASYEQENEDLATEVIALDEEVNQLEVQLISQLVKTYGNPEVEPFDLVQMILMIRYIERMGDHATNIAENTFYLIKGVHFQGKS
ncbi:MAG TPA: phosphate signaling complex protein PhoU [Firmicutes bacterium]|nr:phosphate signaling complex protein PhoU [Bacillales bacterium]HJA42231.1 phosphate signaling complex protein PhoU [Bacillota bacterium]